MKFSICNEIFYYEDREKWPIRRQFETAADIGFDGLEIAPFTLADHVDDITDAQKGEIVEASEDTGVEVAGIHWLLVGPEGMHATSPDPQVRERTTVYLEKLVRLGIDIGGQMMVVGSPQQRDIREGVTFDQAWKWFRQSMRRCGEVGHTLDFKTCIEPLAKETNNNFIMRGYQAARMVDEIGLPSVGIILDTYSGVKEERDLPATIREYGDILYHYHCNDDSGYAPGIGETDFVPVMKALDDVGFERFASIEVFEMDRPATEQAEIGLQTLKDALDEARSGS